ncbi:MAG: ABC transporter ATP-binding protein [Lachnospiraceae bacterium]|nr:ABC transporter ATP-binding protein [Lachnospiraceae bacterium]
MIKVEHLVKQYGDFRAVDDLSFTVEKGEILGFLGPNGAGKSTTMNMITGYNSATEGDVSINGFNVYDEPEKAKRCIGYLPEIPPVYPDMRVKEYLKFCTELKEVPKKDRNAEVERVMELLHVKHMQNKMIKHLSKGYRQRVGLAQALVGNPEVLILDEPTVGLDPMQITWMRELIRNLGREHTIILSSHILFEVNAVCDRVLIINHGKKVIIDTPDNIIRTLGGTNGVRIVVRAGEDAVKTAMSGINNIARIEALAEDVGEGLTAYAVYSSDGGEIRDRIAAACAKRGIALFEMNAIQKTLEDVFIEMTGKEGDTK